MWKCYYAFSFAMNFVGFEKAGNVIILNILQQFKKIVP